MAVNPTNPPVPPITPNPSGGGAPATPQGTGSGDSISSAITTLSIGERISLAFDKDENTVPLEVFARIMEREFRDFKDSILTIEREDPIVFKNLVIDAIRSASALLKLFIALFEEAQIVNENIDTINEDIDDLNDAYDTFQTDFGNGNADQTAIDDFQSEIDWWNGLSAGDQGIQTNIDRINNAIDDYNNYMAGRNAALIPLQTALNQAIDTFNGDVTANNALIDQINTVLEAVGEPPLDPIDPQTSPITVQYPVYPGLNDPPGNITLTPPLVPADDLKNQVTNLPNLDQIDFTLNIDDFINKITQHEDFLVLISQMSDRQLEEIDDFSDLQLLGKDKTVPDADYQKEKQWAIDAGEPGENVGVATMGGKADQVSMEGSLTSAIVELSGDIGVDVSPERLGDLIKFSQFFLLQNSAILSMLPAGRLLGSIGRARDLDHNVVLAAQAIENAVRLGQLTESGAAIFGANEVAEERGEIIQAGVNLSLAQIGSINLTAALGVPGIGTELLNIIAGYGLESPENIFSGEGAKLAQLSNPVNIEQLKANLTDALVLEAGFSSEQAEKVVGATFDAIIQAGPFGAFEKLKEAIQAAASREATEEIDAKEEADRAAALAAALLEQLLTEASRQSEDSRRELLDAIFKDVDDVRLNAVNDSIKAAEERRSTEKNVLQKEILKRNLQLDDVLVVTNRAAEFLATGSAIPLGVSVQNRLALAEHLEEAADPGIEINLSANSLSGIRDELGPGNTSLLKKALSNFAATSETSALNELQSNFKNGVFKNLRKPLGDEGAIDFANRASIALFGSADPISHESERNPVSLVNQLRRNLRELYPTTGSEEPEDVRRANELKVAIQTPSESFTQFVDHTLNQYSSNVVSIAGAPYADVTPAEGRL